MNIHFILSERVETGAFRRQYPQLQGNCRNDFKTQPPRSREGLNTSKAHNVYPGGKSLRRAMATLKARTGNFKAFDQQGHTAPGSMAF